jgi:hypothetical protein
VYAGRRIALAEVFIEGRAGRLVAHGSSLCFVFPSKSLSAPPPSLRSIPEPEYTTPDPYLRPVIGEIIPQEVWDNMSGLDVLTAVLAGERSAPPMRYLTRLRLVEAAPGQAAFALPASEWLCPLAERWRAVSSRCWPTPRWQEPS